MKRIVFLSMIAVFCVGVHVNAQWSESFEGAGTPTGWTVINEGDANGWVFGEQMMPVQDGLQYAYIQYTVGTAHDDYLITPAINVTAGIDDRFGFYAANLNATYADEFNVLVSTTGTAPGDFTKIDGPIAPPTVWTKYSYDLSAYAGQNIHIAIQAISTDQYFLYIDNAVLDALPSCTKPTDLAVANIDTGSAVLSWTGTEAGATWDIQIGEAGFSQTSEPILSDVSNPYNANVLDPGTSYEFYVRSDCGEGDLSVWAGPFPFVTECAPIAAFSQDFEAAPGGMNALPNCWGFIAPIVDTQVVVAAFPGDNNQMLILNNGSLNPTDLFAVPPPISNLSAGTHQIRFRARTLGISAVLEVKTLTDPNNPSTFTSVQDIPITTDFQNFVVSFPATTSDDYIAFKGMLEFNSSVLLDDIFWEPIPSCSWPLSLDATNITINSAELSWTGYGNMGYPNRGSGLFPNFGTDPDRCFQSLYRHRTEFRHRL